MVFTAADARAAGFSRHAIAHRLERGVWQRLLRGVYLSHSGKPSADEWAQAAALFPRTAHSVLSGATGLRYHGLGADHPGPRLLVLVPNDCGRVSATPVTIRHAKFLPRTILFHPRTQVAVVARCVVDACSGSSDLPAVRHTVASAVQRGRCFIEDIAEELDRVSRRGTRVLRQVIAEVADGAESSAEAETAALMRAAGITGFRQNAGIFSPAGSWLGRADFYWEDLAAILEIDSREWHLDPDSWQATMVRHNRMESAGFTVMHCTPAQIRRDPEGFLREVRAWLAVRARSISR